MSLLFKLLFSGKATGTHHKLALDALRHLRRYDAQEWRNVFLAEVDAYFKGAKAPDDEFKDFRNHVLHVRENYWGGAIGKCDEWYGKTVQALANRQWPEAVYNAGVLSHYFTDPMQPFHTGQSEREMIVHRAGEWSIAKSYEELQTLIEKDLGGYPKVEVPAGKDWLAALVRQGAKSANESYDLLIDHYNLELGKQNPPLGFDREGKLAIAKQIAFAAVGFARVLEKAIEEAGVLVPHVVVGFQAAFESMQAPMRSLAKRRLDAKERAIVEAMYDEFRRTGKVLETLPEDDKVVRRLHAEEVLKLPLAELDKQKPGPIGTKFSGPAAVKSKQKDAKDASPKPEAETSKPAGKRDDLPIVAAKTQAAPTPQPVAEKATSQPASAGSLTRESLLVDAPSIGPKTAQRFVPLGIRTIGQFLDAVPDSMARRINVGHITSDVLQEWQDQTRLMLQVPQLRARDAQLLVGIDIRNADELAGCNARDLLELVVGLCESSEGQRILRDAKPPDLAEVSRWVVAAKRTKLGKAA